MSYLASKENKIGPRQKKKKGGKKTQSYNHNPQEQVFFNKLCKSKQRDVGR